MSSPIKSFKKTPCKPGITAWFRSLLHKSFHKLLTAFQVSSVVRKIQIPELVYATYPL